MNHAPRAERARPVLGQQPPLPGNDQVAVRFVQSEHPAEDNALVPTWPYYEECAYEQPPMYEEHTVGRELYDPSLYGSQPSQLSTSSQNEGFTVSQGTLMFIANQGEMRRNPYPQRPYDQQLRQQKVLGPCYRCQGDHLLKDCPVKPTNVANNAPHPGQHANTNSGKEYGHCDDCGVKHLFQDCSQHPTKKGKATVNIVEVLTSSSGSESEKTIPIKAVTRAQAQKQAEDKEDDTANVDSEKYVKTKSTSKHLRDKFRAKYHKKLKVVTAELTKAQEQTQQQEHVSTSDKLEEIKNPESKKARSDAREEESAGSVLADKKFEPLEAILKAYEARIENRQNTMEERWKTYPNAGIEKARLEMCKKMIETAQLLLEPLPSMPVNERITPTPPKQNGKITKQEDIENEEPKNTQAEIERALNKREENTTDNSFYSLPSIVPEVEGEWPTKLWEKIRNKKECNNTWKEAPIEEIDLHKEIFDLEQKSMYGDQGTKETQQSEDKELKELPSYLGPYEAGSDVVYLSSQIKNQKPIMDTQVLQELMSTLVRCTLTIAELLKVKPQMWKEVGRCLEKMGIQNPIKTL
ncbi:hypothetical protein L7F22_039737 [Adiantum nelumboides]|nr:hypothetical protein [Adiantum nelumboides]